MDMGGRSSAQRMISWNLQEGQRGDEDMLDASSADNVQIVA